MTRCITSFGRTVQRNVLCAVSFGRLTLGTGCPCHGHPACRPASCEWNRNPGGA